MHRPYTLEQISGIVNGKLIGQEKEHSISHILLDSRTVINPFNSLFFAIKGERHNGHHYIQQLINKGVKSFVVSELPKEISGGINYILVEDSMQALHKLAGYHRNLYDLDVIGITGSNGKTIVKEWLFQLLRPEKRIVRSPKSYNSQVGVPISVWQLNETYNLAMFEAGISKPGEMEKLRKLIRPNIGILTNIGKAHDENFRNHKQKLEEKLTLFKESDIIIAGAEYINENQSVPKAKLFTWSLTETEVNVKASINERRSHSTGIEIKFLNDTFVYELPFTDQASIENSLTCCAFMLYYGYDPKTIIQRMSGLSPIEMRLELKSGINGCTVINDSYNSDLVSLKIALDFMHQQNQHSRKTLILSDMLESGKEPHLLYKEIADLVQEHKLYRFIGIGTVLYQHKDLFHADTLEFYKDTESYLQEWRAIAFDNECILLKGARVFAFERLSRLFEQKVHSTRMEVDLNAMVENLNYYRALLKDDVKTMAMVKATSYGSGSHEVANILQFHKVNYLAVAYADEGVELRKSGITLPIMVMNPEESTFALLLQYRLEPEIYCQRLFKHFTEVVKQFKAQAYPIHIKLDTGMHRLGFDEHEVPALLGLLQAERDTVKVESVFSHMAASEDEAEDEFSRLQFRRFQAGCDQIQNILKYSFLKHIVNSAGIRRFPEAHFDMVRLGIGLYGVSSDEEDQKKLSQVSTLRSVISQIKNVPAGESIGYNRRAVAKDNMKIATVAIGYADGINRRLSNGKGFFIVKGKKAPIVGNVCMDMCMVDITTLPSVSEGDEVIIFGRELPLNEFAKMMDTIPYEVLTTVSSRVKRIYFH